MDEVNARAVAAFDQAQAGTKSMASLLASYLRSLIDEGFTRQESIMIVIEYQQLVLTMGQTGGGRS